MPTTVRGTNASLAVILAGLSGFHDAAFRQAHAEGRRERADAYAFDALEHLCAAAASGAITASTEAAGSPAAASATVVAPMVRPGRVPTKIIMRIDHDAWIRGHALDGETCDIAGLGPVPVSVIDAAMGDAFLAAIVTKGKDVHTVAHMPAFVIVATCGHFPTTNA